MTPKGERLFVFLLNKTNVRLGRAEPHYYTVMGAPSASILNALKVTESLLNAKYVTVKSMSDIQVQYIGRQIPLEDDDNE